jgi:hypothetical protein
MVMDKSNDIKVDEELVNMWDVMVGIFVSKDVDKARAGNKSAALRIRNRCRAVSRSALWLRDAFR